jgi:hypothetical protein
MSETNMEATTLVRLGLTTALAIVSFLRQSEMLDGKTEESLDRVYEGLLEANVNLENSILEKNRQFRDEEAARNS